MRKFLLIAISVAALVLLLLQRHGTPGGTWTSPPLAAVNDERSRDAGASEPALSLPAALESPEPHSSIAASSRPARMLQRIAAGETTVFSLTPDQVHAHLRRNGTNAESLLAAFNVTSDKQFLREAARRYPSNAFVLTSVIANSASPEAKGELIEQLKRISPDNPLANYWSAREHIQGGHTELALKEFAEAAAKPGFNDFSVERIQGLEEMYLNSGYSAAEAKAIAMASVQIPAMSQLRELGRDMARIEQQYAAASDQASAEALAKMGLSFAANLTRAGANSLLGQIIGTTVEREFLGGLDLTASYDFVGEPVGDRLARLEEQEKSIRADARFFRGWLETAEDAQIVSYFDRLKLYGEGAALSWAKEQKPQR